MDRRNYSHFFFVCVCVKYYFHSFQIFLSFIFPAFISMHIVFSFLSFPSLCFEQILTYEECSCSWLRIQELLEKILLFHPYFCLFVCLSTPSLVSLISFTFLPLDFMKPQSTLCFSHISLHLQEFSPSSSYILFNRAVHCANINC